MTAGAPSGPATIAALARVEGRRLAMSPIALFGCAIALFGGWVFINAVGTDGRATWSDDGWTLHVGLSLMAAFVMVAANRAALRDRRERTVEQHEVLPLSLAARRTALLLAGWLPALIGALIFAGVTAAVAGRVEVPGIEAVYLVQRILVVVMLGALGVALGVWLPNSFVAPLLAFGFYLAAQPEVPRSWHVVYLSLLLDTPALAGWHALYILGLLGLFSALAIAGSRWDRRVGAALVMSCLVVGVSLAVMISTVCPVGRPCRF